MRGIIRYLVALLGIMVFIALCATMFHVLGDGNAKYSIFGFSVGVLFILFPIVFGSKCDLWLLESKKLKVNYDLNKIVSSYRCYFGIKKIDIYISKRYPRNIYVLDGYFSQPKIILGENILNVLNNNELKNIIFALFYRISCGEIKYITTINSLFLLFTWPLIKVVNSSMNSIIRNIIVFYLIPIIFIKKIIILKLRSKKSLQKALCSYFGTEDEYRSAQMKLSDYRSDALRYSSYDEALFGLSADPMLNKSYIIDILNIKKLNKEMELI